MSFNIHRFSNDTAVLVERMGTEFDKVIIEYKKLQKENEELKSKLELLQVNTSLEDMKINPNKEAVVFFAADVSGSMGSWEKTVGTELKKKIISFLDNKYRNVYANYIHHSTTAKLVPKDEFLVKAESGGTIVSSAFRLINKELEDYDYLNDDLDVFVVYISDGDNMTSDNIRAIKTLDKITNKANKFIYFEVNRYHRYSTLLSSLAQYNNDKFTYDVVKDEEDVNKSFAKVIKDIYKAN